MPPWETYLNENQDRYLDELKALLRIPSISSLSTHAPDVEQAAAWLQQRLTTAGLEEVQVLPTEGQPLVYGQWLHAPGKPTVLIYGHFDVQPVDPLKLWSDPPFEPVVREDRIYARGASDDKGNLYIPICAVEAILKTSGKLPLNVKFLLEGQEEIGSPHLPAFVEDHKSLLTCDLILSADGGQFSEEQPALVMGLRGLCALQVDLKGPAVDVHSGTYGGTFLNPIQGLIRLLETLHAPDGRVRVAGFYESVRERSAEERARIAQVPYDAGEYQGKLGVKALFGEEGYSTQERRWIRPTLEFNGIWGGFQEEGIKTVIPSEAHAKFSCRLVPDQTPDEIREKV
ncbi:MAG: dipeptidase, partial [Desulfobacterales bacterium]